MNLIEKLTKQRFRCIFLLSDISTHVRMSDVLSDVLPDGGEGTEDAEDVD